MAKVDETKYFDTEKEAEDYKERFLAAFAGFGNPYEGTARISPPNHDRATWAVYAFRRDSAD